MSTQPPPTQYFPTIYYNPQFWNTSGTDNSNYLLRIGTPTSIATSTSFSGAVIANTLASTTTTTVGTDLNVTNRNKLSSVKTVSGTTTLVNGDPEYINIAPTSSTAFTITLPRCDVSTKIGTKFSFFFTDPNNYYPVITIEVNDSTFERIWETYSPVMSFTISSLNLINAIELVCINTRTVAPVRSVWSTTSVATDYSLFAYVGVPNTFTDTNTFTGGITASATQTINFGTNNPTMGGSNVSGVVKTSGNESISGTKTFTTAIDSLKITPTNRPELSNNKYIGANNMVLDWFDPQNIIFNGNGTWTTYLPSVLSGTTTRLGSRFTFGMTSAWTGTKTVQAQGTQYIYDGGTAVTSISVSLERTTQPYIELLCTNYSSNAICWTVVGKAYQYSIPATMTFNAGITASATQTINFGTNNPTMGGSNVSGVVKTSGNESISGTKTFTDIVSSTINAITTLSIGGVSLYSIFLTTSNAMNDYARLAYNNTFLGTTLFQYYIPTINSSLYPTTNYQLSPKIYVDDSFASVFGGTPKQFLNAISFTNYAPQTAIDPVTPLDLVNKGYIDNYVIGSSAVSNTWVSTNEFTTALRTSVSAVASTDVINKSYADTNLSNASLLSATNTFTGTSNTFTGSCLVDTPASTDISTKAVNTTFLNSKLRVDDTLNNVSSGLNALANVTTGYGNLAFSTSANQFMTTGYNNVGIGQQANYNHNGYNNVAIGVGALTSSPSQIVTNNVAIGALALGNATTGADGNFALGSNCLGALSNGTNNCIMGYYGGGAMGTANYNSGVGYGVLNTITSGSNNSGLGVGAGSGVLLGNSNTFLGTSSGASGDFSEGTAVGYGAIIGANNEIALGRSTETTKVYGNLVTNGTTTSTGVTTATGRITANGGITNINGMNLFSIDTVRTTAFTISSPFFHIYPVNPTANLTITLPVAGATNLGTTFTIRRVGGTATTTIISASSNIYPFTSFTAGNSILGGSQYTTTIVCAYLNNTPTFGWFKIV